MAVPEVTKNPSPPSNLSCTVIDGEAKLSWTSSTTNNIDGYKIYQNGELVGSTPRIYSSFRFPFTNESLSGPLLEMSIIEITNFSTPILNNTQYTFSISSYKGSLESTLITINVQQKSYPKIVSVALQPNPVLTNSALNITVSAIQAEETIVN